MENTEGSIEAALANPISVEEARVLHQRMMAFIFTSKHKFQGEEAAIMGDFISRGIAIGFAFGVTAALMARRHPVLKRHPNLLGFAVAGTADAVSRDYRRPAIYDRLLRLDTPLATRAKSVLFAMRTGSEESPTETSNTRSFSWSSSDKSVVSTEDVRKSEPQRPPQELDWWGNGEATDATNTTEQRVESQQKLPRNQYGALQLPPGGPLKGTRTWDEIRKQQAGSDRVE